MCENEFAAMASALLDEIRLDLIRFAPLGYLFIVEGGVEDLTRLIEEYKGVLDEQEETSGLAI